MTREALVRLYPAPSIVGERDDALPVWPLFQQNATENQLTAYVFESIDLAPIPGFSGVPVNLLIAIDPKGNFLDVRVLSQHEPVFLDGLGEAPLQAFVRQYSGLSLTQNIKILTGSRGAKNMSPDLANLDGVAKATASVRIINQSILSSALKVARKKLGFAEGRDPERMAHIKPALSESHSVKELMASGLLQHVVLSNADIESQFTGGEGAGLDPQAITHPGASFIDLYMAYVSVPSIGRNLLTPSSWRKLQDRLEPGDHAILLISKGPYGVIGDDFVRGSTSDRITLKQDQLPIDMRDLNLDLALNAQAADGLDSASVTAFRIIGQAGLDPSRALDFVMPITRAKGMVYPEKITRNIGFSYTLPVRFYTAPQGDNKSWSATWLERRVDLAVLLLGLAILSIALAMPQRLVAKPRRLSVFRTGFLLFTLFFVGWHAQGQLSIVNLSSGLHALRAGRGLGFLLYDPMTVTLWLFVGLSLLIWGRGTFCGWLCPFGALQELTARLGRLLRIPSTRFRPDTDRRLKWIKYLVLAGLLVSTLVSTKLTDMLVEVEPFKTAITLNFVRAWPFVLYASGLLIASLFVHKFFCRYLCPLGAALALLGRLRMLDWIARRKECGTPCQSCRHQCAYQAIAPTGKIQYDECFQCLDCVAIHASDERCAPLMLEKKTARIIAIQNVST